MTSRSATYLVLGGGIAGVSCVEELSSLCPDDKIILLTATPAVKSVTNWRQVYGALEAFDVEERAGSHLEAAHPNVRVRLGTACRLDAARKVVHTDAGAELAYDWLCVCTGARPRLLAEGSTHVIGIRDTDSVREFQKILSKARRVVVIGNGGIALELVHGLRGCDVVWAIKDRAIGTSFFDAGAAAFFLPRLAKGARAADGQEPAAGPCKRQRYAAGRDPHGSAQAERGTALGSALGPDWHEGLSLEGAREGPCQVHVQYECEVERILSPEEVVACSETPLPFPGCDAAASGRWPVYARLTNGHTFGCDVIVSATGVVPNVAAVVAHNEGLALAEDGGLRVDEQMRTSLPCVYAAGDACSVRWEPRPHWFQMRLWTQARQMGVHAARAMAANAGGRRAELDLCFDLFTHVTSFFGYKVILLGRFNGQGLSTAAASGGDTGSGGDEDGSGCGASGARAADGGVGRGQELLVRSSGSLEYVKVVLLDGRMAGAVLVGDTDLEETFHNLILNGTDLTPYGEDLLHPDVDIEDYFD